MLFNKFPARRLERADRPFSPGRRRGADDPLSLPTGPGEQYRLALAAEAQKWRRNRQQAGALTDRGGMRAWRAT